MSENIRVAIDGPSGAGKSTLARSVAARLGFLYVDTGAIYRTIGYAVWRKGIDPRDRCRRGGGAAGPGDLPDLWDGRPAAHGAEWNGCDGGDPPAGGVPLRLSGVRLSGGSGVPAGDAAPAGPGEQRDDGRPGHRHRGAAGCGGEGVSHRLRRGAGPPPDAGAGGAGDAGALCRLSSVPFRSGTGTIPTVPPHPCVRRRTRCCWTPRTLDFVQSEDALLHIIRERTGYERKEAA